MSATTKTAATAPTAKKVEPRSLRDHPPYVEAERKLAELRERHDKLKRQIEDFEFQQHNNRERGVGDPTTEALAEKLLAGEPLDFASVPIFDVERARKELAVYEAAIRKQQEVVRHQEVMAARAAREHIGPYHRQLAGRMKRAVVELRAALLEERALVDALSRGSVSFTDPLKVVAFPTLGDAANPVERLDWWLREVGEQYPAG